MNHPRLIRVVRITWTAFWGIACVLLCVIWVRSYWRTEYLERAVKVSPIYASGDIENIVNLPGRLEFLSWHIVSNMSVNYTPPSWTYRAYGDVAKNYKSLTWDSRFATQRVVIFPHYIAVLLVGGLGIAPWIRHLPLRFSLRTLLIAMSLVAVGLGAVLWLSR
jgi:hypothetical protein